MFTFKLSKKKKKKPTVFHVIIFDSNVSGSADFYLAGQDVGLDHRVSVFQCKRVFVVVVVMLQLILN